YVDANGDGRRGAGEMGLPGVQVTLSGRGLDGRLVTISLLTDAAGSFAFTDLPPGTYQLRQRQPTGFIDGLDRAGSLGGIAGNDVISAIVVPPGGQGVNYLFGERGMLPTMPKPAPPPPPSKPSSPKPPQGGPPGPQPSRMPKTPHLHPAQ